MNGRDVLAVGVDYDGTLTVDRRPTAEVLDALVEARRRGLRIVLVTGRILRELYEVFPDAGEYFNAIVAENGAVLRIGDRLHLLAEPVPARLADALERDQQSVRRGQALIACDEGCGAVALDAIHRMGLDCQLVYNRRSLMIVPAGVTKATGFRAALLELGLSPHNAIVIGDAENDLALMEAAEIGVAVGNSIESLKAHADIVLAQDDGEGVAALLATITAHGDLAPRSQRHDVQIGSFSDGSPVLIPSFGVNVLIAGGSASGKSYLGGALAERLIGRGYSVIVLDAEGDHVGLRALAGVSVFGCENGAPPVEHIAEVLRRTDGGVVVDLSECDVAARETLHRTLSHRLSGLRAEIGRPHWVVIDEAHQPLGRASGWEWASYVAGTGHCLITYQPAAMSDSTIAITDVVIVLPRAELKQQDPSIEILMKFCRLAHGEAARLVSEVSPGEGLVVFADGTRVPRPFRVEDRATPHVRHWHKYATVDLPWERRFFFARGPGETVGIVAANMSAFHHELRRGAAEVLRFHCANHDFSRWIRDVLADDELADAVRPLEEQLTQRRADVAATRDALLRAIEARYVG